MMTDLTYHEKEQAVFDSLSADLTETGYYFSLRKKSTKAARRDIFIGTENSHYFKFSIWDIPISFPGSSGNFLDFCLYEATADEWSFKFESAVPKAVMGAQNQLSLKFLQLLRKKLEVLDSKFKFSSSEEKHKILSITLYRNKRYKDIAVLAQELKAFMQVVTPVVDALMASFKVEHPNWEAARFDKEDWEDFNAAYQKRLAKYPVEGAVEEDEPVLDEPINDQLSVHPLNQILYGPPGTGKTYYTVNLALNILGHPKYEKREEQIEAFETERKEGKITFTTFHQSMSYEDFVEGIKPKLDDEGADLTYEIKDGILKAVAKLAIQEYVKYAEDTTLSFDERYEQLLEAITDSEQGFHLQTRTGANILLQEVSARGNITVTHENGVRSYIVSRARLEKVFHAITPADQISNINQAIRKVIGGSNASAYWAVNEYLYSLREEKQTYQINTDLSDIQYEKIIRTVDWNEAENLNVDRYVIIIDEINRGNVSGIFGELITLLEQDKRIDQKNRLVIKLPYSKIDFALPSNLYIVGTMNTADRSVEALDTALRRRFSFKEIMPNADIIQSQEEEEGSDDIEGISLTEVLTKINNRIRLLVDRDHQIGHSYFLGLQTLEDMKDTFKNKVIPLLQEYFYNDYSKLLLVLGKGFVQKKRLESTIGAFAVSDSDVDIDLPDYVFELKVIDDKFEIYDALQLLLDPSYVPEDE